MCYMNDKPSTPLNIRLDDRTRRELAALVEHYASDQHVLGARVTPSMVTRSAIHHLYEDRLATGQRRA
jgi:hypothetical protein